MNIRMVHNTLIGQTKKRTVSRKKQFLIGEFLLVLLSKAFYIVLAAILGAGISLWYSNAVLSPLYTATSKLYVLGQEKIDISLLSIRTGTLLAIDYQEVFQTWEIQNDVMDSLGPEDRRQLQLDQLDVSNPDGTRVLYISYTCEDPNAAARIANAFALAGRTFMSSTMDIPQPIFLSVAIPPHESSSMGAKGFAVMGFIWGSAFAVCVIFLKFTFDDHPHRPEDIESAAGIPILAVIPKSSVRSDAKNKKLR